MKVFAINLAAQPDKKEHILHECNKHQIPVEVTQAIYGKALTDHEIQQSVSDYPNSQLTLGEIGCSLSHLHIYQHMVKENIPIALVLEDDTVLDDHIHEVLQALIENNTQHPMTPRVYLLTPAIKYWGKFKKALTTKHYLHQTISAHGTFAYVLNLPAAKALSAFLTPIKYEADRWAYFQEMGIIKINNVVPPVASTLDTDYSASSIESERTHNYKTRGDYFRALRKKEMPFSKKIRRALVKIPNRLLENKANNT